MKTFSYKNFAVILKIHNAKCLKKILLVFHNIKDEYEEFIKKFQKIVPWTNAMYVALGLKH